MRTATNRTWGWWSAMLVVVSVAMAGGSAWAQEVACGSGSEALPCSFEVQTLALTQTPRLFQFQSRLAQAKLPLGKATFETVYVNLLSGSQVVCQEKMTNVEVVDSVLNLTVGQGMSCNLDEAVARLSGLAFQVCLGSTANCLKPIELATTPYAVKSEYASLAQSAPQSNVAVQAHYAQRIAANRDLLLRKKVALGYFDFYTHPADKPAESVGLYPGGEYQDYQDGGFLQWTPLSGKVSDRTLHFVGKNDSTDKLAFLDELVVVAAKSRVEGDLLVWPGANGAGLVVMSGGADIEGNSDIDGDVAVTGKVAAEQPLSIQGDSEVQGMVDVLGGFDVLGGGLHVTGDSDVTGTLVIDGDATITGGLVCSLGYNSGGLLTVAELSVGSNVTAVGLVTVPDLTAGSVAVEESLTAGSLEVTGDATVTGDLSVQGEIVVNGDVTFDEHVVFEGGTSDPGDEADPRYVLVSDETRDLIFDGKASLTAGAMFGAALDLNMRQARNVRIEAASEPPVLCDAAAEGYVYLDTDVKTLAICRSGEYRVVASPAVCGDGFVGQTDLCDDGNLSNGDGCSQSCTTEAGWKCSPVYIQPTACAATCGDKLVVGPEGCDDGNLVSNDGCSSSCKVESGWVCQDAPSTCVSVCGDGIKTPVEGCDDGKQIDGDGCSSSCTVESGWTCPGSPSICKGVCGDGVLKGVEACDDGNTSNGDGCSSLCTIESGYSCINAPSQCSPVCGDGLKKGIEGCDDNNTNNGDGCSAFCVVESGWTCTGNAPSTCSTVCGDGLKKGIEGCDDNNKNNGDGCSASCVVESGWTCTLNNPSVCSPNCGDGQKVGSEGCDDNNKNNGDGCSASCTVEADWKCSGTAPSKCKPCPLEYGGHCYLTLMSSVSWNSARTTCQTAYGGYLAVIGSSGENDAIKGMWETGYVWIGYTDGPSEGVWGWVAEAGENPGYTNWGPNEPNGNCGGYCPDSDCATLTYDHPTLPEGSWNDLPCSEVAWAICEYVP